jgi:hypothetical protein
MLNCVQGFGCAGADLLSEACCEDRYFVCTDSTERCKGRWRTVRRVPDGIQLILLFQLVEVLDLWPVGTATKMTTVERKGHWTAGDLA